MPRNKEFMRIFKDLEMVEHLGSGLPRILKTYPQDCFIFTQNFLRINFPIKKQADMESTGKSSGKTEITILKLLSLEPGMTIPALAEQIGISNRAVEKQILKLKKDGKIFRIGGRKDGHWELKTEG